MSRSQSGPFFEMRNGSGEDSSGWLRNQEILFSEIKLEAISASGHISSENGLTCLSNVAGGEVTGTHRSRKAHCWWKEKRTIRIREQFALGPTNFM